VTRDICGADNSRALTRVVSSRTVICAHESLSGLALSNEQNRITIHYDHTHARISTQTRRGVTRSFTRTGITIAISSFAFQSNQFINFYAVLSFSFSLSSLQHFHPIKFISSFRRIAFLCTHQSFIHLFSA